MKNGLLLPEGETLAEELASPDREIVERAIAGDKDAFSALFRLTYQQMFFAARKILRRDEDIYDALQIGYIKAYKYIDRLNDPDKFVPWLYRIVENAAKDVYKDVYGQSEQMLDERRNAAPIFGMRWQPCRSSRRRCCRCIITTA